MKKETPDSVCPKCEKGLIQFGTCDMYCSNCDYREPHVHDLTLPQFSLSDNPLVMVDIPFHTPIPFMCTCMSWETHEQQKQRREQLKKEKQSE